MLVGPYDGCVDTLPFVPHLGHFHRVFVVGVTRQYLESVFPYPAFRPTSMTGKHYPKVTEAFG